MSRLQDYEQLVEINGQKYDLMKPVITSSTLENYEIWIYPYKPNSFSILDVVNNLWMIDTNIEKLCQIKTKSLEKIMSEQYNCTFYKNFPLFSNLEDALKAGEWLVSLKIVGKLID